jgi:hypothetical protein
MRAEFEKKNPTLHSKPSNTSSIIGGGNLTPGRESESNIEDKKEPRKLSECLIEDSSDAPTESDYGKESEHQFTALLGLPQISLESIY